jgi:hypothetical protein
MKREQRSFFGSLFGAKGGGHPENEKSVPVAITAYSQPNVLQQRMREEKLTHGETVMATLSPVRLEKHEAGMVMYFCPLKIIRVLATFTNGDGGSLPLQASIDGLTVTEKQKPGLYTLKNVRLTSNGTMQVKVTETTTWEAI